MTGGAGNVALQLALTDAEIQTLGERGWFLRDGFLGRSGALEVHAALEAMAAAGGLHPAGLGRGAARRMDEAYRSDMIAWIVADGVPPGLGALLSAFAALRDALNRDAYLGVDRMEVQVARYPGGGAAYGRHRDAFPGPVGAPSNRRVTAIYYANPRWQAEDGGVLRLHADDGAVDLAPRLDRLLVFLSERVEHEVLPTRAARWAVTAWLRARSPLGA
jgi:SM-20-related protein